MNGKNENDTIQVSFEDLKVISAINQEGLSNLSLDKLLQTTIDKVVNKCKLLGGVLFLNDNDGYLYAKTLASAGKQADRFLKLIGQPISNLKIKLDPDEPNQVVKSFITKEAFFSYDLYDFTQNVLNKPVTRIAARVTGTKACISLPILYRDQSIGALFLVKGKKEIFDKELPILQVLIDNIGIAINNANIYKNLKTALDTVEELRRFERDMIDVMAHELKTPMTVILATLQIMQAKAVKDNFSTKELNKYLNLALESTKKEVSLIETLLLATKAESNKLDVKKDQVDIAKLIKSTIEEQKPIVQKKKLKIQYLQSVRSLIIISDKIKLQQIIDNLISNAIKYTNSGKITVNLSTVKDRIKIEIIDTGMGISKEDLAHLGKKFFRVKPDNSDIPRASGTGLGLYIVFKLVKVLRGEINIKSSLGKGSIFTLILPKQLN